MFERARAEKLWFFINSMITGPMWFTPDELEAEQKGAKFIWGAVNWQLRNPKEFLASAERSLKSAQEDYARAVERMKYADQ